MGLELSVLTVLYASEPPVRTDSAEVGRSRYHRWKSATDEENDPKTKPKFRACDRYRAPADADRCGDAGNRGFAGNDRVVDDRALSDGEREGRPIHDAASARCFHRLPDDLNWP